MAALRGKALIAYLVVCVFWGSTYLAIRIGVGELPPFLFAGLRFLVAGALLLGLALALGDRLPRRLVDWRTEGMVGLLLLAGGNTFVVWAEQFTPSGTASIFVVTVALWMAFFDAIIPGGSGELGWGAGAVVYLIVFGSILGYSAYTYALRHASPTIVGTYAYVNPVIAVLLGWLILREPVTARTFVAMALIVGAVVWIQFSHKLAVPKGLSRTAGRVDASVADA